MKALAMRNKYHDKMEKAKRQIGKLDLLIDAYIERWIYFNDKFFKGD